MNTTAYNGYNMLRPWAFRLDPEQAHAITLRLLRLSAALPPVSALLRVWFQPERTGTSVQAFGLRFRNPVGLAAGYDKDGVAWRGLAALGFGHIEIGTVTRQPQPGNPGPRIFRLPQDQAIINRMGFPSRGAAFVTRQLRGARPEGLVLGVNIGKNKDTPLEAAGEDYLELLRSFAPLADYLAINVSSPNTPGLRALQEGRTLETLLRLLNRERNVISRQMGRHLPLLVKLAPDLAPADLEGSVEAIVRTGMDGVIVSNTTIKRGELHSPWATESGGLSGKPLYERSTRMVREVALLTGGRLPIVAGGGIMRPEDACEKLEAGASLLQLYTGLIYAGPGLVRQTVAATSSYEHSQRRLPSHPQLVPQGLAPAAMAQIRPMGVADRL